MKWIKKGLIYKPTGEKDWSKTHAQVPIVDFNSSKNTLNIYFSTRDEYGRSLPDVITVDADNPKTILATNNQPILKLGKKGTFDDCGVMPSWIIEHQGKKYLYYIGWNIRNTIPYHNAVGLAISEDGGKSFHKFSEGPLWDRDYREPHYSGTSCVIIDSNGIWRNWYLSCTEWRNVKDKMEPRYHIKYAESFDGIDWIRKGKVSIDYKSEEEAGIVKASVIFEDSIYKMWYAYRNFTDYRIDVNNSYRIGYAESSDGIDFKRMDHLVDLDVSESGWDSLMISYPHVIDVNKQRLMFYNGNGFGQSGFGYAELKFQ
ncbi:hypothetical protein [Fulvivirga lutimaris]|uniref:hypothetical protein n=1 Tax=Fulvivirga lutimaris TaxID=1819566 RepID=UPI0012BB733C|nr:hypothetical protein [Fulvivirga lutimaris]MTI38301.1 hypothetical protein [Fulvivirga lutimaris]